MSYSIKRSLEGELVALARASGFNGSPFLREPAPLGTLEEELASIWLSLDIQPRPETQEQRDLVRCWARNIVLSSSNPVNRKEEEKTTWTL